MDRFIEYWKEQWEMGDKIDRGFLVFLGMFAVIIGLKILERVMY